MPVNKEQELRQYLALCKRFDLDPQLRNGAPDPAHLHAVNLKAANSKTNGTKAPGEEDDDD